MRHYGVGSCGPRGFYGSFDAHLNLEKVRIQSGVFCFIYLVRFFKALAERFGAEEALVFSSNYATASSTIPTFAKRGDFVICDKVSRWNKEEEGACAHFCFAGYLPFSSNWCPFVASKRVLVQAQ